MDQAVQLTDELWHKVSPIDGWLYYDEALLIAKYAKAPWCEVGCWKGRSTVILGEAGPGWAVDWFKGSPEHPEGTDTLAEFERNVAGLPVTVVAGRFEDVHDQVGDVWTLHLDADHSYEQTRVAFELYSPKLMRGGHLLLHDAWGDGGPDTHSAWPGVEVFALHMMLRKGWKHVESAARMAVFQKL